MKFEDRLSSREQTYSFFFSELLSTCVLLHQVTKAGWNKETFSLMSRLTPTRGLISRANPAASHRSRPVPPDASRSGRRSAIVVNQMQI